MAKTYWRNVYLVDGENCGGFDYKELDKAKWMARAMGVLSHPTLYRIKIIMKENENGLHNRREQPTANRRSIWS